MAGDVDAHRVGAGFGSEDMRCDCAQKGDVVDVELRLSRLTAAAAGVLAPGHSLRSHQDETVLLGHQLPPRETVKRAGACELAVQLDYERVI